MLQKILTVRDSEFNDVVKPYTEDGWKVTKTVKVSDSQSQYVLSKPDTSKKIKG